MMTIAERKAKDKQNLKALILDSAKKLFLEKGIEQTTIRNIADAISYSVGTVYVYYKDKNAILHDLHTQGFMQLGGEMRVLAAVAEPMERLKAMGRVYIDFALKNPDMYDLMFTVKAPMAYLQAEKDDEWNEGKGTFAVLQDTVEQCLSAGYFKGHRAEPLTFTIWSTVHGMCALYLSNRVKAVDITNPEHAVEDAYAEFILMLNPK
jgi:AcrR family transcriptional regulator